MEHSEIQFSFLDDYPSVSSAILSIFNIPKSQLKKFKFKKSFLTKTIRHKETLSLPSDLVNFGKISPKYLGEEVKVIKENEKFLVISKPNKIHSHPQRYSDADNIISWLRSEGRTDLLAVNAQGYDRGLLYRLDYETSGLMIFLKNEDDYLDMRNNFHKNVKEKFYLAVVAGEYKGDTSLIHLLRSSGEKGHKVVEDSEHTFESKFSRLDLEALEYNSEKNLSLLKIKLHQGHRHQIRAQLRIVGHPLLGDKLYGGEKAQRLYLHCFEYQFQLGKMEYTLRDENLELFQEFFRFNS